MRLIHVLLVVSFNDELGDYASRHMDVRGVDKRIRIITVLE